MRLIRALAVGLCITGPALAQDSSDAETADKPASQDALLTPEELQTLVAPVALYPDTLLVQILVAATQPLEVVKAERFLLDNADREPAELEPEIEAMGWDPSVEVLAMAFPEVVGQMATHIDWTETAGAAMLAQSEDVMDAVQVMRDQAIDTGALVSGEEQTVEVTEDDTVVVTPTDPQVVYVPEYETTEVYSGTSAGDVLGSALLFFGTVAIINEIFDDDDDWYDYWGCRNCGGWGDAPIIRNPDIDIDVDGNVNIGNDIDIGWKPDPDRADEARDRLADRERPGTMPVERRPGRTDELRDQLTERTGTADISRPGLRDEAIAAGAGAAAGSFIGSREGGAKINRGDVPRDREAAKAQAIDRTRDRPDVARPAVQRKPSVAKKPQLNRASAPVQRKPSASKGQALKKKSGGNHARKASSRGKASRGKARRR